MKKLLSLLMVLGMIGFFQSCSSSSEEGDDVFEEEIADGDADTDAAIDEEGDEFADEDGGDEFAADSDDDGDLALDDEDDLGLDDGEESDDEGMGDEFAGVDEEVPGIVPDDGAGMLPEAPMDSAPMMSEAPMMPAASGGSTDHTVRRGDTLMKLAYQYYGDVYRWREIYESNRGKLQDPNIVSEGTNLRIDNYVQTSGQAGAGERYRIERGDTLGKISGKIYGTPSRWKELHNNNAQLIKNPNRIYAGFYLYYVPGENGPYTPQEMVQDSQPQNFAPAAAPEAPAAANDDFAGAEAREPSAVAPAAAPAPEGGGDNWDAGSAAEEGAPAFE